MSRARNPFRLARAAGMAAAEAWRCYVAGVRKVATRDSWRASELAATETDAYYQLEAAYGKRAAEAAYSDERERAAEIAAEAYNERILRGDA